MRRRIAVIPRMFKGTFRWLRDFFMWSSGCVTTVVVGPAVFILFVAGVVVLPTTFGETVSILGLWAAFGALIGQNKRADTPFGKYINGRIGALAAVVVLFVMLAAVFLAQAARDAEVISSGGVFGLFVLATAGLALGFVAGADKDRPRRIRRDRPPRQHGHRPTRRG